MKSLVIYDSQYGNTKLLAEEVGRVLEANGEVKLVRATEAGALIFGGEDLLVVAGPTIGHGLSPNMKSFFEVAAMRKPEGGHPVAIAFDTRLSWPKWLSGSAAGGIARRLEQVGCRLLMPPESFIVKGAEGPLATGERERAIEWARRAAGALSQVGNAPSSPR